MINHIPLYTVRNYHSNLHFTMSISDLFKRKESPSKKGNVIEDYELENVIYRKITEELRLVPYDAERFFKFVKFDAQLLSMGIDDNETKTFLPGLSISEEELKKRILSVEAGLRISYLITVKNMPVGMIDLDPPKANKIQYNMPIWTIDYFVVNNLRNKGLMTACFPAMLKIMANNIGIKDIYAWVHEDNTISIRLLEKFFFRQVDSIPLHDSSKRPIITPHYLAFKCPVQELRFLDKQINCPAYWADKPTLEY